MWHVCGDGSCSAYGERRLASFLYELRESLERIVDGFGRERAAFWLPNELFVGWGQMKMAA